MSYFLAARKSKVWGRIILCLPDHRQDPNPPHQSKACLHDFLCQGCLRVQWIMPYCFPKSFSSWLRQWERCCTPSCTGSWRQLRPVSVCPQSSQKEVKLSVPQAVSRQGCSCCVGPEWWALSLPAPPGTQQCLPLPRSGLHLAHPWASKG